MAISGKSSSVAALLLLVAVLAGSCATGANATCPVANNCTLGSGTLVNVTVCPGGGPLLSVVVAPGQIVAINLLNDIKIVVGGKTYTLLIADIQKLLNLKLILDLSAVVKLEILCPGTSPCGNNALAINIYANVNVLGLLKVQLVGAVCAKL